jgi:hypothetical protein
MFRGLKGNLYVFNKALHLLEGCILAVVYSFRTMTGFYVTLHFLSHSKIEGVDRVSMCLLNAGRTKLPGLERVVASGAGCALQCTMLDRSLPSRVIWVAATDPPSLVMATQCHLTRQFGISLNVPLLCQVWPPDSPGWRVVLDFSTPHTGQPVLEVHLLAQLAMYGECLSGHSQRYFLLLLFATWLAGGLLECHFFLSLEILSTDRHGQNLVLLLIQYGQTVLPPFCVSK